MAESDILSAFEFIVTIGSKKLSFSKVSNIKNSIGIEVERGYGNDSDISFLRKNDNNTQSLILEKGVALGDLESNSLIYNMTEGVIVNNLNISVRQAGKEVTSFMIEKGIISDCSYSDLDAINGRAFIKKIEIVHGGLKYK